MSTPSPCVMTAIFHVKDGVDFNGSKDSPAMQTFARSLQALSKATGLLKTSWGTQVENPHLFVWCNTWETFEHNLAYGESEAHRDLFATFGDLFDVDKAPPLIINTHFKQDTAAAFDSGVTEVALFTLPNGSSKDAKAAIEEALKPIDDWAKNIGKATGAADGWVSTTIPPRSDLEWLHGLYGYDSVDAHLKFKKTAEHAKISSLFQELEKDGVIVRPAEVPGIDPKTGCFHVHFRSQI